MNHRFIHYQGPNAPDIIERNQFESDKPDDVKSFTQMLSYWETQSSKGGEIAKQIVHIQCAMGLTRRTWRWLIQTETPMVQEAVVVMVPATSMVIPAALAKASEASLTS